MDISMLFMFYHHSTMVFMLFCYEQFSLVNEVFVSDW